MLFRLLPDKAQRCLGADVAYHHPTGEIELASLALVLSVKVHWFVVTVEHPNHDSEEDRDRWHTAMLPQIAQQA
jgi:hypothetical protein